MKVRPLKIVSDNDPKSPSKKKLSVVKLLLLVRSSSSSNNIVPMHLGTLVSLQGITASRITIADLADLAGVLSVLGQVLSGDQIKMPRGEVVRP